MSVGQGEDVEEEMARREREVQGWVKVGGEEEDRPQKGKGAVAGIDNADMWKEKDVPNEHTLYIYN